MARRDVVVIGASAGGVEAIKELLATLPEAGLDAAVFVVVHIPASGGKALGAIFDRAGPMPAAPAVDGEHLEAGRVYVAVADHHLLLVDGHVGVRRGPRESGHRPSVDALFRSAARYYGPRAIGVVLTGTLDDGTSGAYAIRRQGGVVVVQSPDDAMYDGMPTSAIERAGADHVVPLAEIGPLLARLVTEEVDDHLPPPPEEYVKEVLLMEADDGALDGEHPGVPSPWPCPDCNGVLWAVDDGAVLRFRCRVGHGWAAEALIDQQGHNIEEALWVALRALEDRAALARTLAERAESSGRPISAERFREDQESLHGSIDVLRRLIGSLGARPNPAEAPRG